MKKFITCLMLCSLMLTQGCSVQMTDRQVKAVTAVVVIGAALAILSNNSSHNHKHHKHYKRGHSSHGHGSHCRCRHCH